MNLAVIDRIAAAVLYEGYLLYPYRASSLKNRQRWTFGALFPDTWSGVQEATDAAVMQTECLVEGDAPGAVQVRVRFLHLLTRTGGDALPWQEAVEREVVLDANVAALLATPVETAFRFDGMRASAGGFERHQEAIEGLVALHAEPVARDLVRITVRVRNVSKGGALSDSRDAALMRTFVSTHTLIGVERAQLVSLLDPPERFQDAALSCKNVGTWPVMVGDDGDRSAMLSSPIILYDYPRIAPESPGDLFDGTEIDEILTLRILTLTDDEKRQMREVDPRARALLDRTEALGAADLMKLHGHMREPRRGHDPDPFAWGAPTERSILSSFMVDSVELAPGSPVRLAPRGRADIFDIALAGKAATVASVEQDFEGQVYFAVTIDEDPGSDLGAEGKPGHRFFFRANEVIPR